MFPIPRRDLEICPPPCKYGLGCVQLSRRLMYIRDALVMSEWITEAQREQEDELSPRFPLRLCVSRGRKNTLGAFRPDASFQKNPKTTMSVMILIVLI